MPVAASQIKQALKLAVMAKRESGLIAQALTLSVWPARVRRSASDSRKRVLARTHGAAPGADRRWSWGSRSPGTGSSSHRRRL